MHVASGRVNPREGELDGLVVHQFQDLDPLLRVPLVRRFRMAPALAGLARRVQPDVVHSHYLLPYGYWTARAELGPLVVSPWGKDAIVDAWQAPEAEERARVAIAPERALAYVVNSQALEDAAVRLGADRAKFHRIFWHARIDGYSPEHADRSRWQALGWPGRRGRLPLAAQLPPVLEPRRRLEGVCEGERGRAGAEALLERGRRLDP